MTVVRTAAAVATRNKYLCKCLKARENEVSHFNCVILLLRSQSSIQIAFIFLELSQIYFFFSGQLRRPYHGTLQVALQWLSTKLA